MTEKKTQRPAWAYTLSAAAIAFALSAVIGAFDETGRASDFVRVVGIIGWIAAAGGAVQFLMSRRE